MSKPIGSEDFVSIEAYDAIRDGFGKPGFGNTNYFDIRVFKNESKFVNFVVKALCVYMTNLDALCSER